jgi:hypothetical protein
MTAFNKCVKRDIFDILNGKCYKELSNNFKNFIKGMFPNVKANDLILCQEFHGVNIDFTIIVNGVVKYISVKTNNTIFVLKDNIFSFLSKLASFNVSQASLSSILKYHFGNKIVDGNKIKKSYGSELMIDFKDEIRLVEQEFQNPLLLSDVIDYLLIKERNGKCVDYFYFGNLQFGYFLKAKELKNAIINENNNYPHNYMRIGPFNFISLKRENEDSNCLLRMYNIGKYFKKKSTI